MARIFYPDELLPYQAQGTEWLYEVKRGILGDDPGLGKTVQALSAVDNISTAPPILIVCPSVVRTVWAEQIERWLPGATYSVVKGKPNERAKAILDEKADFVILHYDVLWRDFETIRKRKWGCFIFDEAHRMKNRKAKVTKHAFMLTGMYPKAHLFFLTGTPIMNKAEEIWTLLHMIDKKTFKGFWNWAEQWLKMENTCFSNFPVKVIKGPKNPEAFKEHLRPYLLRRTKADVYTQTPPVRWQRIKLDMTDEQAALYRQMKDKGFAVIGDHEVGTDLPVTKVMRLRQFAISPQLVTPEGIEGCKLQGFLDLLDMLDDRKVVVFSDFATCITRLAKILTSKSISNTFFTGDDDLRRKTEAKDAFISRSSVRVFLTTIKSGGEGMDGLQHVCSDVVFIDEHWNPKANEQAVSRVDRKGQTEQVNAYVLQSRGTIDGYIAKVNEGKIKLFEDTIPITQLLEYEDIE